MRPIVCARRHLFTAAVPFLQVVKTNRPALNGIGSDQRRVSNRDFSYHLVKILVFNYTLAIAPRQSD